MDNGGKMKHIALLLPGMRMGGAEKICLNFLEYLIKDYKVTMILSKQEGDLLPLVPKCVDIIEDKILDFRDIIKDDIRKCRFKYIWKDFIYYFKVRSGHDSEKNYKYLISRTPSRNEHYDCAISYVGNVSTQIFCLADRINADIKIAWIHGETTELKDTELFTEYYEKIDKIFCVSQVTKSNFLSRFPQCIDKVEVYYNPIHKSEILEKSKADILFKFNKSIINIVTVGRLSPEKGMDMIPEITLQILREGFRIHWYVIGDGSCKVELEKAIEKNQLNSYITLTGNQINPYPFIKQCDIYVQPSYEEGYSTTICEAGILGKTIVGTTTSGGIREQIEDEISGVLAKPTPIDLANKIIKLINDENFRHNLEKRVLLRDYSNSDEFEKLKNVIEGGENVS